MNKDIMLRYMCSFELANTDIKAIVKARGFAAQACSSSDLLQHIFLSDMGVEEALASLSRKEILVLHLLNHHGKDVGIEFFERAYNSDPPKYSYSFTQQYNDVYKAVKNGLIRKGVLLFAEETDVRSWERKTKLAKRRFLFPREFAPFLPPLFRSVKIDASAAGDLQTHILRRKVLEAINNNANRGTSETRVRVVNGELLVGKRPFSVRNLRNVKIEEWERTVKLNINPESEDLHPVQLIFYALCRLKDNEWADPDTLVPLLKLALNSSTIPDMGAVCRAGWVRACLEKIEREGKTLYRLPRKDDDAEKQKPESYLDIRGGEAVGIDMEQVPLDALEVLSLVSTIKVQKGVLAAYPNFIKISHAPELINRHPVFLWLCEHHQSFRKVVQSVKERAGKIFIHNNLMLARIKDLSLKVSIEKSFPDGCQVVSLSDEYIAFPRNLLPDMLKIVKKSGHVLRTLEANGDA